MYDSELPVIFAAVLLWRKIIRVKPVGDKFYRRGCLGRKVVPYGRRYGYDGISLVQYALF